MSSLQAFKYTVSFIIHITCPADPLVFDLLALISVEVYSKITSTNSPSFCMTTFSVSLIHITASLPQTHDFLYCVIRRKLTPPPLRLHNHTDLRAYDFAHPSDLWHQPGLTNVTCAWSWRLCGINTTINKTALYSSIIPCTVQYYETSFAIQ
jgi:hypothetical protein